jgi:hypothetical protein
MTSDIDVNTNNSKVPVSLSVVYGYDKSPVGFATMDYLKSEFMKEQLFQVKLESLRKEADKSENFKQN